MKLNKIIITGGAGYVGTELSEFLSSYGYEITVYDLCLYGTNGLELNKKIKIIKGDIRNISLFEKVVYNHDICIHLACISNDPSFELNPKLGKQINLDSFEPILKVCLKSNVKKFIYASSSSVYGIKKEKDVHEDLSLEPLTDYSLFKAKCENILKKYSSKNFITCTLRPATVCGYSRRQRLDLVVNILTNLAFNKGEITVYGGEQLRPNINIKDMCRAYLHIIEAKEELVNGEIFNVGFENYTVNYLANLVKDVFKKNINIKNLPTEDNRSYHISSNKIIKKLEFKKIKLNSNIKSELMF
jgi:nucleoside-diphosphate-sugar epimerase